MDGAVVTEDTIIDWLVGSDVPGTFVTITVNSVVTVLMQNWLPNLKLLSRAYDAALTFRRMN